MIKKTKNPFNLKDIKLDYVGDDVLYVRYKSKDNEYNARTNKLIQDFWRVRQKLVRSYPLVEVKEGFEYEWMGVYMKQEYIDLLEADRDRRKHIRNAPVLSL